MSPEQEQLLVNISVYVEALVGIVHPDVFADAVRKVNTKRAAMAQARSELAAQQERQAQATLPVVAAQAAPATALASVPTDLGSTTEGPKRRGRRIGVGV